MHINRRFAAAAKRRKEAQINIIPVIIEKHICGDVTFFEQQYPIRTLSANDWVGGRSASVIAI